MILFHCTYLCTESQRKNSLFKNGDMKWQRYFPTVFSFLSNFVCIAKQGHDAITQNSHSSHIILVHTFSSKSRYTGENSKQISGNVTEIRDFVTFFMRYLKWRCTVQYYLLLEQSLQSPKKWPTDLQAYCYSLSANLRDIKVIKLYNFLISGYF